MAGPREQFPDPIRHPDAGTPRWVKVGAVVAVVLVALVVVMLVTGRGGHGPGRHAPGADRSGGHTEPPPGVTHEEPWR